MSEIQQEICPITNDDLFIILIPLFGIVEIRDGLGQLRRVKIRKLALEGAKRAANLAKHFIGGGPVIRLGVFDRPRHSRSTKRMLSR